MPPPYSANSSSSPFPFELSNEDHDHHHHQNHTLNFTSPNYHVSSSSSPHSQPSHLFLNSSFWDQPQLYYDPDPQFFYPQHHKVDNHAANGRSYDQGPKMNLWRSTNCEDSNDHHTHDEIIPVKWMSSKMRVMQKMKSSNHACQGPAMASAATTTVTTATTTTTATATTTTMKIEDEKRASSCLESEHSSNSSSNHSSSNVPIRVCVDCNTTKTPLWRSGPKGPKSLCNACGIRQRKARRAMAAAAAAAAANCAAAAATEAASASLKINKVKQTKEKMTAAAKNTTGVNHHHHHDVTPLKKRCKIVAAGRPSDHGAKTKKKKKKKKLNNGLEDLLIKLSKNSAYQRMFPQDEKDAAILLMALSCGLVHS